MSLSVSSSVLIPTFHQSLPVVFSHPQVLRGGNDFFFDTKGSSILEQKLISEKRWNSINAMRGIPRGGGGTAVNSAFSNVVPQPIRSTSPSSSPETSILKPQAKAVLHMSIAMSLHYLAYSLARPTTLALFTSAETGFAGNHGAFPLAMACISPTSLLLLLIYGKVLHASGPRVALRQTTFLCSSGLGISSMIIYALKNHLIRMNTLASTGDDSSRRLLIVIKLIVGALFIFRESYVQLLTSQYWSFIASVLNPRQSSRWFAPITGLTSITSAIAGLGVSTLVDKIGLTGALCVSSCVLVCSLLFSESAYKISDENGFNPVNEHKAFTTKNASSPSSTATVPSPHSRKSLEHSTREEIVSSSDIVIGAKAFTAKNVTSTLSTVTIPSPHSRKSLEHSTRDDFVSSSKAKAFTAKNMTSPLSTATAPSPHLRKSLEHSTRKEIVSSFKTATVATKVSTGPINEDKKVGMLEKASNLFARVPVLKALFIEILTGQGLATLLNVCFVAKLSQSIAEDGKRAGWMGKYFATINIVSSFLQFAVMPQLIPRMEPRNLWRFMPLGMLVAVGLQSLQVDPSLYIVSGAFMLMKVMEFSIRRLLDEMIYVPLDFESRFVGKEIISVFGYRFGKSGMSLVLSALTSVFGSFGIQQLSYLTMGSAVLWLFAAWNVSNLVPTRAQAEEAYKKNKGMVDKSDSKTSK